MKWGYLDPEEELTATKIIEGEYTDLLKTLESETKYPDTDMPAVLISGVFLHSDSLSASVETGDMEVTYDISYKGDNKDSIVALRLYDPFRKYEAYAIDADGNETLLESDKKGSYAEIKGSLGANKYVIRNTGLIDRIKNKLGK